MRKENVPFVLTVNEWQVVDRSMRQALRWFREPSASQKREV
jgi:hypothetical protein